MWGEEATDAKQSEEIGRKKNRKNKEEVLQTLREGNWSLVIWVEIALFVLTCAVLSQVWGRLVQSLWDSVARCPPEGCNQTLHKQESPRQTFKHKQTLSALCSLIALLSSWGKFFALPTCSGGWSSHTRFEDRWPSQQTISPCGSAPPRDGGEWRCRNTPAGPPYWFSSQGGAKYNDIKMCVQCSVLAWFKPQRKKILHSFPKHNLSISPNNSFCLTHN